MNLEQIYRNLLSEREDRLEYSGTIKGTCKEYCPYFEYLERNLRCDINKYEKDILVKKYYRSSAGRNKAFPEDVRPIEVLHSALIYLFQFIDFTLESYKFLENRTRAIRLDISIQDLECDTSIEILECICRFHILYGYALYDNKDFEDHLNLEQCKKVLSTLEGLYCKRGKCNDEFAGYSLLISFDDKAVSTSILSLNSNKINLITSIKSVYLQNNLHAFFKLSRSIDFLSYCLLHTYFDKVRLKGIEIYSKCFVEKINTRLIKKMMYLSDRELISLCRKTNVLVSGDVIDFKNKDLFYNEDILIKDRKISMKSSKLVYLGDIDFYIRKYIIKSYITKYINSTSSTINIFSNICKTKKTKFDFLITEEDILNIVYKIYSKIFARVFIQDIKKRVLVFEKKKRLAKGICNYILDLYIKKRISNKIVNISSNYVENSLAIINDDSIYSAIFINKIKKSPLIFYNPVFIPYQDITPSLLLKYKVSVFSFHKNYIQNINSKYYMLNKIVDTPQNMTRKINEIDQMIRKSSLILKSKLNLLLDNKSRIKQLSIITYLMHNGRNPDIEESWIEKVDKKERFENIEVYYEENASMY